MATLVLLVSRLALAILPSFPSSSLASRSLLLRVFRAHRLFFLLQLLPLHFKLEDLVLDLRRALRDQVARVLLRQRAHIAHDALQQVEEKRKHIRLRRRRVHLGLVRARLLAIARRRHSFGPEVLRAEARAGDERGGGRLVNRSRSRSLLFQHNRICRQFASSASVRRLLLYGTLQLVVLLQLAVKHLRSEVPAGLHIGADSLDGLVHLDDLFEEVVLLLLLHDGHDCGAVLDEVLLPLDFERAHLLQVVQLELHELDLLLDINELVSGKLDHFFY